ADEETVTAQRVLSPVFQQPVDPGPEIELEAERELGPELGTIGGRTAARVPPETEAKTDVGHRPLGIFRESIHQVETREVGIDAAADPDFSRGTDSHPGAVEVRHVESDAGDQLVGALEVHAQAGAESGEANPDARGFTVLVLGWLELLRGERWRENDQ